MSMLESPLAFAYHYAGRYLGDGQCVALVNQWLTEGLGKQAVFLNAVDWARAEIPGMTAVLNGPTNFPASGDIVVWHAFSPNGIGPYGHVAVCLAADSMHLVSLDQNWGLPQSVRPVIHDFGGVALWHAITP